MKPAGKKYLSASVLVAGALGGWFWWAGQGGANLAPGDPQIVARGKLVYQESCAACHGNKLQGQVGWQTPQADGRMLAPPHSAKGHTWHHTDALLIDLTTRGTQAVVGQDYESDMPGFGGDMPQSDIVAVLSFIKSTWPDEIKIAHDKINTRSGK
ncbi:MAG: c-type cytochrome [Alphaproteobacteria bacterium]